MCMEKGGFVPWDQFPVPIRTCPCCGVMKLPTEEELEQRITEQIDGERLESAIREAITNKAVTT